MPRVARRNQTRNFFRVPVPLTNDKFARINALLGLAQRLVKRNLGFISGTSESLVLKKGLRIKAFTPFQGQQESWRRAEKNVIGASYQPRWSSDTHQRSSFMQYQKLGAERFRVSND